MLALRSIRLPQRVGSVTQAHAHSVLLLAWWAGNERAGEDHAQRVGSGIYLRLALAPAQKTLSGKIVTKCHDFHSSWRSAEFWDSQHEFLTSSGSK